jgi:multicomponent Na+:H+ antiporter subunit D
MLRAGARIFLGWGSSDDRLLTPEPDETPPRRDAGVGLLTAVCAVTLALGLVASIVPGLVERTELGATRFVDGIAYGLRVLHGTAGPAAARPPFALSPADRASLLYALAALAIALATAAFGLWHERLPKDVRGGAAALLGPPVAAIRAAHSGVVGDYLLWMVAGTSAIGLVWATWR